MSGRQEQVGVASFLDCAELAALGLQGYGTDVLISRKCSVYAPERLVVGSHVRIDDYCVISCGSKGRIVMGDYVHVSTQVALFGAGCIEIGDFCTISPKASVFSESDDFSGDCLVGPMVPWRFRGCTTARVTISNYCAVGASSVVLPGVTLAEGAVLGALSLAGSDLPPWGIYAGAPARRIHSRSRSLVALAQQVRSAPSINIWSCDE